MKKFPDKKLSKSRLQRLYRKFKINRKKIKLIKYMNHNAKKRLCKSAKSAKDMVKKYIVQKYRIIYCDETMITRSTIH